jgi:hypothetical protein
LRLFLAAVIRYALIWFAWRFSLAEAGARRRLSMRSGLGEGHVSSVDRRLRQAAQQRIGDRPASEGSV